MAKYTVTIDTDNAAFEDDTFGEVSRILRELANRLDGGTRNPFNRTLYDINGNKVGHAEYED